MDDLVFSHHLPLVYFFLIAILANFTNATFVPINFEELNTVSYHVDILNDPILSAQDPSNELVMLMTSKYGQKYECLLPNIPSLLHDERNLNGMLHGDSSSQSTSDISLLLKPLETSPCLIKTKDWWTYKFCYGKHIKQYHLADNKIVSPIIVLGLFESEYDWKNESKADESSRNRLQRYHSQYYVNGSTCDITGTQRRSEVRFLCEDGAGDYIAHVDEPESCRYIMTIHTTKVCQHPSLRPPPNNKPHNIVCNPVLTSDQYTVFLKREEETRKAVEERRKEWLAKQEEQLLTLKQVKEAAKQKEAGQNSEKENVEINKAEMPTMQDDKKKEAVEENDQRIGNKADPKDILNEEWESYTLDLENVMKKFNKVIASLPTRDGSGKEKDEESPAKEVLTSFYNMLESQKKFTMAKLMKSGIYRENARKFEVATQKTEMQMEPGTEDENDDEDGDYVELALHLKKTRQDFKDYWDQVEKAVNANKKAREDHLFVKNLLNAKKKAVNEREFVSYAEKVVAEQLGIDTRGRKVEVKIVSSTHFDDNGDVRTSGDDESGQIHTVLIKLLNEDATEHLQQQSMLEKNYQFVWNDEGEKTKGSEEEEEAEEENN